MKIIAFIAVLCSYWSCRGDSLNFTLDINFKGENSKCFVEDSEVNGLHSSKYVPIFGHNLTKIIDGSSVLWECNTVEKKCNVVVVYSTGEQRTLVYLVISDVYNVVKEAYFENSGSEWLPIDKAVGYARLGLHMPGAPHGGRTLNISKVDASMFNVKTSKADGVTVLVYSPKVGIQVGKVVDRNGKIWEDDSKKFMQTTVHSVCGKPLLSQVLLETQDGDGEEKCYEKDEGQWNEISEEEYTKAVENVKFYRPPFDISNADLSRFRVEEYEAFGMQTLVYTLNSETPVTRIVEGSINIWESKLDDKVDKVWVYSKAGDYLHAQLRITNSTNGHVINQYKKHKNGWSLFINDDL
ncbi:signal peptide-containing protein [Theileria equi strain WA]|uniref:Signal peptide-containing protein n=1 Tax=Theileria equi strain WA TaxID=1537102 RepID=L0AVV4_THEEQ|nr:signal peptide-containing protein [Theileria equi strain WA]AFZ79680.1 signal peptide-containing protein [Theileria equi strain WA]|eukprot:XP_004829346.1 signal peptide-containing protein [Theileria equi strain WA]